MSRFDRKFEDSDAVRARVPLLVGLMGPSGGGKTYSALRLATGIQRVSPGPIFVIDTEARRALHYADKFAFKHVPFGAPFSPLDYLAAIRHCVDKGAGTIIVDSMSHEHEGPGGVLEMHEAEFQRMGARDSVKMLAWAKPKQQRRTLINSLLQIECNMIFCFRAKDKIKPAERGATSKEPVHLGFMPIAGEEFLFEMTANALLLPNAGGVPEWKPTGPGEQMMVKLPEQFRSLLLSRNKPLDEEIGEAMARWGAGGAEPRRASATDAHEKAAKWATWCEKNGISESRMLFSVAAESVSTMTQEHFDQLTAKARELKAGTPADVLFPEREPGIDD